MQSTVSLYGCEPTAFIHLPYLEALAFKYDAAKRMVEKAMEIHHTKRSDDWMLSSNAMKHNRSLILEAGYAIKYDRDCSTFVLEPIK